MSKEFDEYIRASRELNDLVENHKLPIATWGDGYSVSTVAFKKVPPLVSLVASSGQRIEPQEIPTWNERLWPDLQAGLAAASLDARYPCCYFYGQNDGSKFVLDIGFPVPDLPEPIPPTVQIRRDPEHWCASAVLVGPFIPHIGHAWDAATAAVVKLSLKRSGEDREIYHHMTGFICTEVQIGLVDTPDLEARVRQAAE